MLTCWQNPHPLEILFDNNQTHLIRQLIVSLWNIVAMDSSAAFRTEFNLYKAKYKV